jgi:hypothetical protein
MRLEVGRIDFALLSLYPLLFSLLLVKKYNSIIRKSSIYYSLYVQLKSSKNIA